MKARIERKYIVDYVISNPGVIKYYVNTLSTLNKRTGDLSSYERSIFFLARTVYGWKYVDRYFGFDRILTRYSLCIEGDEHDLLANVVSSRDGELVIVDVEVGNC